MRHVFLCLLRPSSDIWVSVRFLLPSFFLLPSQAFSVNFCPRCVGSACLTSQEVMEPMSMRGPLAESDARPKIRPVRGCWHGSECKWLAQQRCLFMHTEQEQRDVPLRKEDLDIFRFLEETRAEVGILRDAVIRLSASIMWERGSVLTDGVQVHSQECAQARTSEQCGNIPAPLIKEDTTKVVQVILQERLRARIAERAAPIPVPPVKEDTTGVVQAHHPSAIRNESVFPINLISVPSGPTMFSAK